MKINFHKTNEALERKPIGIVITIPRTIKWEDYEKELAAVADGRQEMNFRVNILPTRVHQGDRCYLCYGGNIVGWMTISHIGEKSFRCTTTGRQWETGNYVSRTGKFYKLDAPIPCKGFRGFRYIYLDRSGNLTF